MGTVTIISKLLDLLVVGTLTYERLVELKAKIDAMQAAGRDPTDAEWAELFDGIAADGARLDDAAKAD